MKIFISWSRTRSRHIATALRDWLPNVIQSIQPFLSSQDISKGARGNVIITKNLEDANFGIIVLTPENLESPWILFEAGALSKLSSAYVCTYLYELQPANVNPPLGQFQHTRADKTETFAMLQTINSELKEYALPLQRLSDAFEIWWPKLEAVLKAVPPKPDDENEPIKRSDSSKLDEVLELLRSGAKLQDQSVEPLLTISKDIHDALVLLDAGGNSATLSSTVRSFLYRNKLAKLNSEKTNLSLTPIGKRVLKASGWNF